ncbi:MAG: hypothetical protein RLZZ522_906, partial [Verrucomicrobiota bacterium]
MVAAAVEPGISELLPAPEIPAKLMPKAVDMDGDGDLDVVFPGCRYGGGDSSTVEDGPMGLWIENLGQRNFSPPRLAYLRHAEYPRQDSGYTLGDFTASPGLEILVTEAVTGIPSSAQLWRPVAIQMAAPGGSATRQNLAPDDGDSATWHGADLDGDGPAELLKFAFTGNGTLVLTIWQRDSGGSYILAGPGVVVGGSPPAAVTLVDIDGDGDLDLVREYDGTIQIHERTGVRSFAGSGKSVYTGVTGGRWGDLDGDGLPEWFGLNG